MTDKRDAVNLSSTEKRMSEFFFALSEGGNDIHTLANAVDISLSTAKRYAKSFEGAGIARPRKAGGKHHGNAKLLTLSQRLSFSVAIIGNKTVELSVRAFSPKYEYSVTLPYNESFTEEENAFCVRKNLEALNSKVFAEKSYMAVVVSDGSCIKKRAFDELHGKTAIVVLERGLSEGDKKAREAVKEEAIFALVIEMIRDIRAKERD